MSRRFEWLSRQVRRDEWQLAWRKGRLLSQIEDAERQTDEVCKETGAPLAAYYLVGFRNLGLPLMGVERIRQEQLADKILDEVLRGR